MSTLTVFLDKLKHNPGNITFDETMEIIAEHYEYTPTTFSNGLGQDIVINEAGSNEGSCKLFAFAQKHDIDADSTLALFGDYYRKDVLENPDGTDHANIRNFIKYGWDGIRFDSIALSPK